jgi:hypothetical protein
MHDNLEAHVHCPSCHQGYVHFAPPRVDMRGGVWSDGGGEDKILVPMHCEWGHCFELEIRFVDGFTFVTVEKRTHPFARNNFED